MALETLSTATRANAIDAGAISANALRNFISNVPHLPQTSKLRMLEAAASEFYVATANTPELLREAYRLRHQVYCVERGYEASDTGLEIDAFDDHAPHVVVCRRTDDEVIGTVRLVLPQQHKSDFGLPIHALCTDELGMRVPLGSSGEVSRFAVSKERRGMSSEATGLLRLALVQGLVKMSAEHGVTHWCAMMERSLLRLLRSSSIDFEPVGPMVEHHGMRQPSVCAVSSVLQKMRLEQPEIWDFVTLGGSLWNDRLRFQSNGRGRLLPARAA
jgi:N-acyl amino acid synthase of PEP-CTERM/exosortase system